MKLKNEWSCRDKYSKRILHINILPDAKPVNLENRLIDKLVS